MRGRRRGEGSPPYGEVASSAVGRADRGVRPYGAIRGVVRDRVGRPQGSPLRKRYKGCSARQAGDRKGRPYGGLQEVRWGGRTEASAPTKMCCRGGVLPRPRGQSPSPTHSLLRTTAKKRDTRGCLFFCIRCESYLLYRALSAAAISAKIPACFLPTTTRITSRVAIISTTAIIMQITTFCSRPAMMKLTKETAATVTP